MSCRCCEKHKVHLAPKIKYMVLTFSHFFIFLVTMLASMLDANFCSFSNGQGYLDGGKKAIQCKLLNMSTLIWTYDNAAYTGGTSQHFHSTHTTEAPISSWTHTYEAHSQQSAYLGFMTIPVWVFPLTEQMHQLVS